MQTATTTTDTITTTTTTMSSGKKNQREPKFNFSVINEIRSVICVESFNMISQKSMKVPQQKDSVFKLYHGEREIMSQAEKFIKRMSVYTNLWEVEETKGGNRFIIPERLHQQYGKVLVAGDNITDSLIKRQQYEKNEEELLSKKGTCTGKGIDDGNCFLGRKSNEPRQKREQHNQSEKNYGRNRQRNEDRWG